MFYHTIAFYSLLLSTAAFALPRHPSLLMSKRGDIAVSDWNECTPGGGPSSLPCASSDFICCMGASDAHMGKFTCRPAQIDSADGCVRRGFEKGYEEERQKDVAAAAAALRHSSSTTSTTSTTTTSTFIDSIPNGYYAAPVDKTSKSSSSSAPSGGYQAPSQPTTDAAKSNLVEGGDAAAHSVSNKAEIPSPALSAAPALSGPKAQVAGQGEETASASSYVAPAAGQGEEASSTSSSAASLEESQKPVSSSSSSSVASQPSGYAAPAGDSSSTTTSSSSILYVAAASAATPAAAAPLPACSYPYTGSECNSSHTPASTKSALIELCKQCAASVASMDVENKLKDCLGKVEGGDRNSLLVFETFGVRQC